MSTINMFSVILKIWSLISAFMFCDGSSEFFTGVIRENFVCVKL